MPSIRTRIAFDRITLAEAEAQAKAIMPDIPPQAVNADYTGAVLDGQLPLIIQASRFDGEDDVTEESAWSATLLTGDATFTVDADEGRVSISAITTTSTIEVVSEHNDIERSRVVTVPFVMGDPPPSSGAGSESAYDSSITSTTADSYGSANAGPLTLTCGASGEVELTAPLEFSVLTAGSFGAYGKWQVSAAGAGTWSDVDTEIAYTVPAEYITHGQKSRGVLAVNQTASGLTPTNSYDFQLLLRNESGSHTTYYFGTATATTE